VEPHEQIVLCVARRWAGRPLDDNEAAKHTRRPLDFNKLVKSHGSALSLGGIRAPEHRHVVAYTIIAESADATGCVAQIGHTQHDIVLRDSSV
jgi:hypothetical protein